MMFGLLMWSCGKEDGVCWSSNGSETMESRSLADFSRIEIHDKVEVEIYPNSGESRAEVIGGKHLIQGCKTEVKDGLLLIENNNRCNWLRDYGKKMTIRIYLSELKEISFYGGADIKFKDTLTTDIFTFLGWESSGDVDLLLNSKEAYIKLNTGTTDVQLHGRSDFLYYYSLTQGFIYGKTFSCQSAQVVQRGYGDMYVNPKLELTGEIKKSGNLYYPGNIATSLNITGSGRLLKF